MRSAISEPCYILLGCFCFFTSISLLGSRYEPFKGFDFLADIRKEPTSQVDVKKMDGKNNSSKRKVAHLKDNSEQLSRFFLCLDSLQKKKQQKLRIAHFGDSMIEGDLITGTLREQFQAIFGGSGVGFVQATPPNPAFRQTISQDYSGNWQSLSIKDKQKEHAIGLSGYTSLSNGDTWIKLGALPTGDALRIFYGASDLPLRLEVDSTVEDINAGSSFGEYNQIISQPETTIRFSSQHTIPVYGLSVESDSGIIVDNFSFRGSSGTFFKDYNKELLQQFQAHLQYDLIILQYGVNVADAKTTDYSWYERNMLGNINYLKSAFPDVSILLIGCGDRAVKYNGTYSTSKGIEPLIQTQMRLAESTGSGFLNFYRLMGGKNSMVNWVTSDTCFANKDYIHFNRRGAEKSGKLIFHSIISDFDTWKKKQVIADSIKQ